MAAQRTYSIETYREAVWTLPWVDDAPTWDLQPARDALAAGVASAALDTLDGIVVDEVVHGEVPAFLLKDDASRPLSAWWWHLGQIRRGSYPAALLPPHLRAVYQAAAQAA